MTHVIVVGSGMAGLGAAYTLHKAGVEVTLLESRNQPGGRTCSVQWHGVWIDQGAEFFAGADIQRLAEPMYDTHLTSKLITYPSRNVVFDVWRDGAAHRISFTNPLSFLRFGAMSPLSRLQLLRLIPLLLRQVLHNSHEPYQPWLAAWCDTETVEAWLNRLCPELLEYAIEPCFELYCGYEPHSLSKAMFAYLMTQYTQANLTTLPEGTGQFTRTLAAYLGVTTNAIVTRVDLTPSPVVHFVHDGNSHDQPANFVILAIPGLFVSDLVPNLPTAYQAFFETVCYTPHELHHYRLSQPVPGLPPATFYPRREDDTLAALSYSPAVTDPTTSFLRPDLKTARIREWLTKSPQENLALTLAAAIRRYPQIEGHVTDGHLSRWPHGLPMFPPGYCKALQQFMQLPPITGLAFAGDYLAGPSTGAAYASGQRAAQRVLHQLR